MVRWFTISLPRSPRGSGLLLSGRPLRAGWFLFTFKRLPLQGHVIALRYFTRVECVDNALRRLIPRALRLRFIALQRRFIHRFWAHRPIPTLASAAAATTSVASASALTRLTLAIFERFNDRFDPFALGGFL